MTAWLAVWLAVLAVMLVAVLVRRDLALDKLAKDVTAGLTQCYSTGKVDHSTYTSGWSTPSLQGSAIYLLERGRRYPKLERELLITEALRSYDWIYLYSHCWNYDLRMLLIDRCKKSFPNDAEVAWASGRILLTAGHYSESVDELERAIELGLDYPMTWIHEEHVRGRLLTALLMEGRVAEWEYYLLEQANADKQDEGKAYRYINALLVQGKYDQALLEIENRKAAFDIAQGYSMLMARALYWSGWQSEFEAFISSGFKNATLSQNTKQWASALVSAKPPDIKAVLLLEELEALIAQYEKVDQDGDEAYEREGWQAASRYFDLRAKVSQTRLPFEIDLTLADHYALSFDQGYLETTLETRDELELLTEGKEWHDLPADPRRIWNDIHNYLGRCYVMAHEWDKLVSLYQESKEPSGRSAMKDSHRFLAMVASGKPLVDEFEPRDYYRGISIHPSQIASAEFQSALAFSGREFSEVMGEIQELLAPFRQRYNDYSNDTLKIPWVKLAETDSYSWEE